MTVVRLFYIAPKQHAHIDTQRDRNTSVSYLQVTVANPKWAMPTNFSERSYSWSGVRERAFIQMAFYEQSCPPFEKTVFAEWNHGICIAFSDFSIIAAAHMRAKFHLLHASRQTRRLKQSHLMCQDVAKRAHSELPSHLVGLFHSKLRI